MTTQYKPYVYPVRYKPDESGETWWCRAHRRPATWLDVEKHKHICNPHLSGIMLPCQVVEWHGSQLMKD